MIVAFLPLLAGIFSIILGSIVLFNGTTKTSMRWPFALFATSVGVWAIFVSLFLLTSQPELAEVYVPIYYIAALCISYSFMVFCLAYSDVKIARSIIILAAFPLIAMAWVIISQEAFITSVSVENSHYVSLAWQPYLIYSLLFITYVLIGLTNLYIRAVKSHTSAARHRRVLALWLTVSLIGGGFFNLFLPALNDYTLVAWGPVFTFVMVASVFYVIARHGLFDIRQAVVRTIAYLLSLVVVTSFYLLVVYVVFNQILGQTSSAQQMVLNMSLTLLLAFSFQPIKRFFDRLTNRLFYKDIYNVERFYAELNKTLSSTVSLNHLLKRSAELIAATLKSEAVGFFVYAENKEPISYGSGRYGKLPLKDMRSFDGIEKLAFIGDPDIDKAQRRILLSHRIAVVIPLRQDTHVIGFLTLGEHRTSHYSGRDLRVLETISGELAIGIQNALSVQEVRDLNANLEQRIEGATKELRRSNAQLQKLDEAKDEFISMASHQLRTPLTSIKGYLSMLIEGDLGKVSKEQEHVLNEAFVSSERMVRLISDFLNVSRLQTGKFVIEKHPIDLALLVQREIDGLVQNASSHALKFTYTHPKNLPLIELDENKIQQVVMNFCDNAIYYSKEKGTINVSLKKVNNFVEFKVVDDGIGVPKEDQEHLFNKFYRATNAKRARPDGTGVGLFLTKKVIDDHGGEIIFSSTEGKGSTFGFRLPIH